MVKDSTFFKVAYKFTCYLLAKKVLTFPPEENSQITASSDKRSEVYECWKVQRDSSYVPEIQLIRTSIPEMYIQESNQSMSSKKASFHLCLTKCYSMMCLHLRKN